MRRFSPASASSRPAVRWPQRVVPPAILLLAWGLRLFRLGDANVWWDEALAVWAVRKGLVGATLWTASDVHPPLFFWTLWGWVQAVGESEVALRLLPAACGFLTVAAVYALARLVGGRQAGALGDGLHLFADAVLYYAQQTPTVPYGEKVHLAGGAIAAHSGLDDLGPARESRYVMRDDASDTDHQVGVQHGAVHRHVHAPRRRAEIDESVRVEGLVVDDVDACHGLSAELGDDLRRGHRPVGPQRDNQGDGRICQTGAVQSIQQDGQDHVGGRGAGAVVGH